MVWGLQVWVIVLYGWFIDILFLNGGKGVVLWFEVWWCGLCFFDCIVVGDSGNDVDMLLVVGCVIILVNVCFELVDLVGCYILCSCLFYVDVVFDGFECYLIDWIWLVYV